MDREAAYIDANKKLWNERVAIHLRSSFYDTEGFKRGDTSLTHRELSALGDVKGKTLLHLQCHFGMDTISWTREGAVATGIDFSEEAIRTAAKLAEELQADTRFLCSDVYGLPDRLDEKFDIVFTSYGVIGWLPDLEKWASVISHFLKPGGIFFIAEFHPVIWMMDEAFTGIKYSYFNEEVIEIISEGSYADRNAPVRLAEYGWNHSFEEIIGSLLKQGLQLVSFKEYPSSPYNCFSNMTKDEEGYYRISGLENKLPMTFELKAVKK